VVTGRFQREAPARIGGATVTFEPGAHTDWHSHPLGQTLIVTQGHGFVQEWQHQVRAIGPGDTVWIAPGVKHWHGAAPHESMTHVAIAERLKGQSVTWMEKVSGADYAAAALIRDSAELPAAARKRARDGDGWGNRGAGPQGLAPVFQNADQAACGDMVCHLILGQIGQPQPVERC
jgi:quercetin dioxygenase-like cupin family protein